MRRLIRARAASLVPTGTMPFSAAHDFVLRDPDGCVVDADNWGLVDDGALLLVDVAAGERSGLLSRVWGEEDEEEEVGLEEEESGEEGAWPEAEEADGLSRTGFSSPTAESEIRVVEGRSFEAACSCAASLSAPPPPHLPQVASLPTKEELVRLAVSSAAVAVVAETEAAGTIWREAAAGSAATQSHLELSSPPRQRPPPPPAVPQPTDHAAAPPADSLSAIAALPRPALPVGAGVPAAPRDDTLSCSQPRDGVHPLRDETHRPAVSRSAILPGGERMLYPEPLPPWGRRRDATPKTDGPAWVASYGTDAIAPGETTAPKQPQELRALGQVPVLGDPVARDSPCVSAAATPTPAAAAAEPASPGTSAAAAWGVFGAAASRAVTGLGGFFTGKDGAAAPPSQTQKTLAFLAARNGYSPATSQPPVPCTSVSPRTVHCTGGTVSSSSVIPTGGRAVVTAPVEGQRVVTGQVPRAATLTLGAAAGVAKLGETRWDVQNI